MLATQTQNYSEDVKPINSTKHFKMYIVAVEYQLKTYIF
jgi:hypothetical protein